MEKVFISRNKLLFSGTIIQTFELSSDRKSYGVKTVSGQILTVNEKDLATFKDIAEYAIGYELPYIPCSYIIPMYNQKVCDHFSEKIKSGEIIGEILLNDENYEIPEDPDFLPSPGEIWKIRKA